MAQGNYKVTNNPTATYGENSKSTLELQQKLNSMGANIALDSKYGPETQKAYDKYMGGSSSNLSGIETPTPATDLTPSPNVNLPEPQATNIYDTYTSSLISSAKNIRTNLENTYKTELSKIQEKKSALEKEQKTITDQMNPEERATAEQEKRIMANELQAAEAASGTIEADFSKRRSLAGELENLLNQGNNLIQQQKTQAVGQGVINKRVSNTMSDISARAGVIEAVFSALDGNISQAYNIINQAKTTVAAHWKDNLDYYGTLLDLNNKKILNLDKDEKDLAEKQVGLIESDMKKVDETAEYIKGLMIDPESSQFVADAGVKLTDSVEEINKKLATQSKVEEIKDVKNKMSEKGYIYVPFPSNKAGLVSVVAGDQTFYFKEPAKKTTTSTSVTQAKQDMVDTFDSFLKTGTAPSGDSFGNGIGEDGYVDPYVYNEAVKQWPGTIKEFLAKFPVKQYVNPESYKLLPEAIRPTSKSSNSATGMSDEEFLKLLNSEQ